MRTLSLLLLFASISTLASAQPSGPISSRHVLLIGIDGMTSDALQFARLPNIASLIERGAVSLTTRAVMPTVSTPNWMSILSGAGPEQHGVTSNRWSRASASIQPVETDEDGYFPGLFHVLRKALPSIVMGAVYDQDKIDKLFNRRDVDLAAFVTGPSEVTAKAGAWLAEKRPNLLFAYYSQPDEAGHAGGFGTRDYLDALENVDREIGTLLQALARAGLRDETTVLVVTDHGATPRGHGGENMAEIEVPWIIAGKDVAARGALREPNNTMNTAATILHIFGVRPPASWVAQPYLAPFRPSPPGSAYVPKPRCSLASGIYLDTQMLSFEPQASGTEIRFTLDGTRPSRDALLYTGPVRLYNSAMIRAACFTAQGESRVAAADVAIVADVKTAMLLNPASEKYPAEGALSLIDGRNATADMLDPLWLGFAGSDLVLTIRYAQKRPVKSVTVSFLRDETSWIFTPDTVMVFSSQDGGQFEQRYSIHPVGDVAGMEARILRIEAMPPAFDTEWLRIIVKNVGVCPPDHPGAGKKAWLFVDEIEVK